MNRLTDVVRHLLIINVIVYLGTMALSPEIKRLLSVSYPTSPQFQPFQIITHMFMHADFRHLLFNMLMLFFLGPLVEARWGPKKFLAFYFITGLGALAINMLAMYIEVNVLHSLSIYHANLIKMLGASGAVFGVVTAMALLYPNVELYLFFIPFPVKAKYLISFYVVAELFLAFSGMQTGIAHWAHLGGALFGAILTLYWNRKGFGSNFDRWN
ncbi:MAG: rhomboid family intramembrane serine protease [Saprospiraceae bacterium]|nr:rhomboid family intramembrane serine protease [Saprospiraceae bacterium]